MKLVEGRTSRLWFAIRELVYISHSVGFSLAFVKAKIAITVVSLSVIYV